MYEVSLSVQNSLWWDLAILAAVFAAAMTAEGYRLRHGQRSRPLQILLILMLTGYLLVYAWLTVFYRSAFETPQQLLTPFWSYIEAFSLEGGLQIRRLGLARQILLNILVYMPLGILLPGILREGRGRGLITLLCGFGLSLLTEVLQYFTRRGYCEVDDLINNTLGCLLGLGVYLLGALLLRRLISPDTTHER